MSSINNSSQVSQALHTDDVRENENFNITFKNRTKLQPAPKNLNLTTYTAKLMGGTVTAVPLQNTTSKEIIWRVQLDAPNGVYSTIYAPLKNQFGAEHLKPGSHVKKSLEGNLRAAYP
jgi:hypothetical protein